MKAGKKLKIADVMDFGSLNILNQIIAAGPVRNVLFGSIIYLFHERSKRAVIERRCGHF
jgi:hypothetical protein